MAETDLFVNDYPPNTLILQVVHFSNLSSGNPKLDTGGELGHANLVTEERNSMTDAASSRNKQETCRDMQRKG